MRPLVPILLLLGQFAQSATARTCHGNFEVNRTEDVELLFKDCTQVSGDITITSTYSGPFILPNVEVLDGSLVLSGWVKGNPNYTPPKVTSVELPDILQAERIGILGIPTLTNIALPKLWKLDSHFSVFQDHPNVTTGIDIGSLEEVGTFHIGGGFSSLNVSSLRNVEGFLDIYGPRVGPMGAQEITFPSLQYARRLWVEGRVSSISMPELRSLGRDHTGRGYSNDVVIKPTGPPASFSFPRLEYLTGSFELAGPIKSLDLSSLQSSRVHMRILTSYPLNLSLGLVKLDSIYLQGDIQSIKFPNLQDFNSIEVDSEIRFGCQNFTREMDEISGSLTHTTRLLCHEPRSASSRAAFIALILIPSVVISGAVAIYMTREMRDPEGDEPEMLKEHLLEEDEKEERYELPVGMSEKQWLEK